MSSTFLFWNVFLFFFAYIIHSTILHFRNRLRNFLNVFHMMKYGFIKKNKLTEISLFILPISFLIWVANIFSSKRDGFLHTHYWLQYKLWLELYRFLKHKRTERPTSLNMSNKARLLWKLKRKSLTNGFVYRLFRDKVNIWFWTHFGRLLWVFRLLITAFFIGWWSEGYVPAIICLMVRDKQLLAQAPQTQQTLLMWALGNNLVALRNATIYRFIY